MNIFPKLMLTSRTDEGPFVKRFREKKNAEIKRAAQATNS